jgi:asparagine synthase (glutamine-hydrolysing)
MCGIAGIISFNSSHLPLQYITAMNEALAHRGPDDEGYVFINSSNNKIWMYGGKDTPKEVYSANLTHTPQHPFVGQDHPDATVAFGHRRLSIIDLSAAGHQPFCTPDKRYWIVYNGEIYNYLELRKDLMDTGYNFTTNSDTEVLLYAYVNWGPSVIERLVGMFAFSIYDRIENTVFSARDFFGIKPFYFTSFCGGFAFASEIKALLCLPQVSRKANAQKVYEYLRFGLTDHNGDTLIAQIHQLPPAHYLKISLDHPESIRPVRYWDINLKQKSYLLFNDATDIIRQLFLKNIKYHLRSDVPVGAALSGGIDSSSIIASIRLLQNINGGLHSFSYIANEIELSEEKWVDIITRTTDAVKHVVSPTPDEFVKDLDRLILAQDEPFGSMSIYAQYRVMQVAKEKKIKVLLDGQGADELLAGYSTYLGTRLASLIYNFRWLAAVIFIIKSKWLAKGNWKQNLINTGKYFLPESLEKFSRKMIGDELFPNWLRTGWFKRKDVNFFCRKKKLNKNIFREELYCSLTMEILPSLLRYEDRNSMAFSVESRVPFLTPELVDFIFSLPEKYIIDSNGTSKAVFRAAMKGIVPDAILNRRDKIGFRTPDAHWIIKLESWATNILKSELATDLPMLNQRYLIQEWQRFMEDPSTFNYQIWRWINFIKWSQNLNIEFN